MPPLKNAPLMIYAEPVFYSQNYELKKLCQCGFVLGERGVNFIKELIFIGNSTGSTDLLGSVVRSDVSYVKIGT